MTSYDWLVSNKKCPMCGNTNRIHAISVSSEKGEHYWEDTEIYLRCGICFFESDHWRKNRSWKKRLRKRWTNESDNQRT